ncbi:hypothetical protein SAMN05660971_04431 [Halomonas cupida]|uniref:Uncharacterized protein n=1 Tax=Halomonas cupida TaxID=44933 RepID=A0A1M7N1Z6_9GAMM|nr:hypothetical protein SAMN05660971_04431 [Halomonas cupida]
MTDPGEVAVGVGNFQRGAEMVRLEVVELRLGQPVAAVQHRTAAEPKRNGSPRSGSATGVQLVLRRYGSNEIVISLLVFNPNVFISISINDEFMIWR